MPRFVAQTKKGLGRSRLYERARASCLARSQVCWICSGEAADAEYAPISHSGDLPYGSAAIDMSIPWPSPASASADHVIPISVLGPDDPRLWRLDNLRPAHLGCNSKRGDGSKHQQVQTLTSRNWLA